jgi:hypothetical protein
MGGIDIKGGQLPYTFEITPSKRAPGLSWLVVDRTNGALTGTPMESAAPLAFEVKVTDGSGGACQQVATKSFELRVDRCVEGETVDCFVATAGTCAKGTALCTSGVPGACEKATTASTDLARCGESCGACDAKADRCVGGKCQCGTGPACATGKICCSQNGVPTCIDAQSDAANCGACGKKCEAGANATAACVAGTCSSEVMCLAGFDRCDVNQPKACVTPIQTDVKNCGACGNACPIPTKASGCEMGRCVCGQDKRQCSGASEECCPMAEGLPASCADLSVGQKVAGGIRRCGGCGGFCADPLGMGAATCTSGKCGTRCVEGWADCEVGSTGQPRNCSTNLAESVSHCGKCGNPCPGPISGPGAPVCSAGKCEVRCAEGYVACPLGASGAVICVNPKTDVEHCGGCNLSCSFNNVDQRACVEGVCRPSCVSGFGDCDTSQNNGCEEPLNTVDQCGGCGQTCSRQNVAPMCSVIPHRPIPPDVCAAGVCSSGFADCNGDKRLDGCEADLGSIVTCGSCGNRCPAPDHFLATCSGGSCGGQCEEGYTSCNGASTDRDGCETFIEGDSDNCGGCRSKCPTANNFTGGCSLGKCTCFFGGGYDCDGDPSNGCAPCDP